MECDREASGLTVIPGIARREKQDASEGPHGLGELLGCLGRSAETQLQEPNCFLMREIGVWINDEEVVVNGEAGTAMASSSGI